MEAQEFKALCKLRTTQTEEIIKQYLPGEQGYQKTVIEAMNYSLLAGGKRLRPLFMWETYRMLGGVGREIEPFMAAIEMIHTYSLVHDDLPAMDNDEYRRGRETTWKVYGEGMGILAGDGLLNYAYETALSAFERFPEADKGLLAKALRVLAVKAGIYGMVGGQTADIEAETQVAPLSGEQLMFIHGHKTAALLQAAMLVGAILAGAGEQTLSKIETCAYKVGIAFQIQDDVLDVTGDSEKLGKPVGSDDRNHKQTYVTLNGLEQSREAVKALSEEAVRTLEEISPEHAFMKQLVTDLIYRTK
ncbi:MAG: polyprenyl synthetase family protein [Roseburia sp.]|nr:polyprenyl synthetase family protein [Roseburia sp.]